MITKHTPGPWKLLFSANRRRPVWIEYTDAHGHQRAICEVKQADGLRTPNGQLIAAAPVMLEALENALGAFNSRECNCDGEYVDGRLVGQTCYFHRIEQDLLAAIKLATGGLKE